MKTTILSVLLAVLPLFAQPARASGGYGDEDAFVAHEWGTFTSVQGADGILMPWNPYLISELPKFVYNRTQPRGDADLYNALALRSDYGKYNLAALQRMETPVIYFYSLRERTVDVSVKFPLGLVTEWYPQAQKFGPAMFSALTDKPQADSFINWKKVKILPTSENAALASQLPSDQSGSHYFAARATDAALVKVSDGPIPGQEPEHEKFLFYRGLGQFPSPLKVSLDAGEQVVLENTSGETIRHAFVFQLHHGQGSMQAIEKIAPGKLNPGIIASDAPQKLTPQKELLDQMCAAMEKALIAEGLFPKEAAAMVNTWRDSWFAEEGMRVFYLVPPAVTANILPLTIEPKPKQVARVFVGRAEIITPAVERHLREQITRFGDSNESVREQAVAEGRNLNLGRFTAPAITRATGKNPPKGVYELAWKYYSAIVAPPAEQKTASARWE